MSTGLPLLLDLRHYETVAAVVELQSTTRAAERLSITQSAVSHRIAEAERRLGVPLFSRGADRRLTPTGHGLAVQQVAVRAIAELRRVEETLLSANSATNLTVRVAVSGYEAYRWFPEFMSSLRLARPDVELDLVTVGESIAGDLGQRSVDLVLAPGRPDGELDLLPLFEDELVLLCAPDHPLAGRRVVDAADLVDQTLLTYNARPFPGFEYDRFVRPSGYSPQIVRVVPQTSAIIELVAAGAGVAILSRWATGPVVDAGRLSAARCGVDGVEIWWHAATRRADAPAREVARLLRDHVRQG